MIPILYQSTETQFISNGIGRLRDCISCTVTEQRNGIYECEFQYPVTGKRYADIQEDCIVSVTHDDNHDRQPFRIYRRSAPINGIVTFNARHISYDLNNVILQPFTGGSVTAVFAQIDSKSINTNPFTFWTDKTTVADFALEQPASVRAILGGVRGSILDVYGGEYAFDGYTVRLYNNRGNDTDITLRYGKNIIDLEQTLDSGEIYDACVPFWYQDGTLVTVNGYIVSHGQTANRIVALDMTQMFEDAPTESQIRSAAQSYLTNNKTWVPKENIKVDFVALWQTQEYKDVAALQRVRLCDTVNVYVPHLGLTIDDVKVVKVVYNVLADRYDEIELGEAKSTFAQTLTGEIKNIVESATKNIVTKSVLQAEIDRNTQLITGGLGGHVVYKLNANGKPEEILVMDTDDVQTAVNVIRINMGGIGFSTNGYNGPFTTAWTIDGHFNADFITAGALDANLITTGTLNADLIRAGRIADKNNISYWDLDTGLMNFVGNMVMSYTYGKNTYQARFGLVEWQSGTPQPCFRLLLGDTREMDFYIGTSGYAERLAYKGTPSNFKYERSFGLRHSSTSYGFHETIQNKYQMTMRNEDSSNTLFDFSISRDEFGWKSKIASTWKPYFKANNNEIHWETSELIGAEFRIDESSKLISIQAYYGTALGISSSSFTITTGQTVALTYATDSNYLMSNGRYVAFQSTSSRRYKEAIKPVENPELDPHRLYQLDVKQFRYHDGMILQYGDMANKTHVGFIAEEVNEIYPDAVIHNMETGQVESWDERRILPPMLKLIQEQKTKIDELEARITRLETLVDALMKG